MLTLLLSSLSLSRVSLSTSFTAVDSPETANVREGLRPGASDPLSRPPASPPGMPGSARCPPHQQHPRAPGGKQGGAPFSLLLTGTPQIIQ